MYNHAKKEDGCKYFHALRIVSITETEKGDDSASEGADGGRPTDRRIHGFQPMMLVFHSGSGGRGCSTCCPGATVVVENDFLEKFISVQGKRDFTI